jgi:outer membrane translocation and assembly module TamA
VLNRDTRDNIFSPNTGWDATARVRWHWGEFLGDFSYTEMDLQSRYYFTAGPDWHFAWKLDSSFTNGDVPFYALPAINLRGIAKQRYQGESVAMTEFEGRYSINPRWSVLGFAGVGRASDRGSSLGSATDRFAGGAGFRYLLARLLGLQTGIDVARGPDEWAFYLQVGSAWTL